MVYIFFMKSSFTFWREGNNMLGFSLTTVACFRPSAKSRYFFTSLLRKRSGLHMWSHNRWLINRPKRKHTNSIATLIYKCAKVIVISEEWKWKLFFPALITRYSCIFWATGSIWSIPAKKPSLPPFLFGHPSHAIWLWAAYKTTKKTILKQSKVHQKLLSKVKTEYQIINNRAI